MDRIRNDFLRLHRRFVVVFRLIASTNVTRSYENISLALKPTIRHPKVSSVKRGLLLVLLENTNDITSSTSGSEACKSLARKYFDCRMKAGLMTPEDLSNLGFPGDSVSEQEIDREFVKREEVLAELDSELEKLIQTGKTTK